MADSELCFFTATELTRRIRAKELSCVEVMEAHIAQIERVNSKVNAIVTFLPEHARHRRRQRIKRWRKARSQGHYMVCRSPTKISS